MSMISPSVRWQKLKENKMATFKPSQNSDKSITLVHFVLDETGSMGICRQSTIDGFNEYVNGLKQDGNEYRFSLTKFDSSGIDTVYRDLPINEVPNLTEETYSPCAMTNLNDAIGKTLLDTDKIVENSKEAYKVLIVVMTDGAENASSEFRDPAVIKEMITEREQRGWTVTFLGANIDAQAVGQTYGMAKGNVKAYSTRNMGATMRGLAETTSVYAAECSAGATTQSFFDGTDDWSDESTDASEKTIGFTDGPQINLYRGPKSDVLGKGINLNLNESLNIRDITDEEDDDNE